MNATSLKRFVLVSALCILVSLAAQNRPSPPGAAAGHDVRIVQRYLRLPVAPADKERVSVRILSNREVVRYFDINIAGPGEAPLFWASLDVGPWLGRTLRVECDTTAILKSVMAAMQQGGEPRWPDNLYKESRRPQFHFSPRVGWTNDPNGLAYLDGEYHLFFQHNPYGVNWGNMTWGHAVSRDLVHWEELGDALHPDELGTIYSGSGVVDRGNTSGLQGGAAPPLLVFYTSAGEHSYRKGPYTQSMAYSTDRGRTFTKYAGNPVVGHIEGTNRDPKVFWHEPSRRWVMVLYLSRGKFRILGSKNLREWEKLSDVDFPDGHECPELFELPVDGMGANTRWVFWEGGGRHQIGRFDGSRFVPETGVLPSEWGSHSYAAQTWNNVPDGRRLWIGWMRYRPEKGETSVYQGMPFNQQMTFPRSLSLRTTTDGVRLFAEPAAGIAKLYTRERDVQAGPLSAGTNALAGISGELFDIEADLDVGDAASIELGVRGAAITYDARSRELTCLGNSVRLSGAGERLQLRILADRTSLELFAADGRYVLSFCFTPKDSVPSLTLAARGAAAIRKLKVRELKSIW